MGYYNTNIVNDVGIKHSYPEGTLVQKYGDATNTTVTLHTVTAGKTLYIDYFSLSASLSTTGLYYCRLFITTDADVVTFEIDKQRGNTSVTSCNAISLFKPIIVPSGHKVKLQSNSASIISFASIQGIEV